MNLDTSLFIKNLVNGTASYLKEMDFEKKLDKNPELKLREKMKDKWNVHSRKEANQKANRRILIIAATLAMLAYYFLLR